MEQPALLKAEILAICPGFAGTWEEEGSLWTNADGTSTFHGLFAVLSRHVAGVLENGKSHDLEELFDWVEKKLTDSNGILSEAVATCFLENLMNRVPAVFSFETFGPMLGPESKRFCTAYGGH